MNADAELERLRKYIQEESYGQLREGETPVDAAIRLLQEYEDYGDAVEAAERGEDLCDA